ncbi:MAG TPA: four-carbon acid sugar kinase family protein [Verrucomicrobia bacterium]|nr:four-carbon acid sugar kinase family protein [Verrucomicrobiota bacterium]HOP99066.1 four-carbon acid sugar kinase family protein [Verrucomicrobiota bacterium]
MSLWLTYYADDFTGATDALEQLTVAGVRTVLFTEPPTARQLKQYGNLQAIGVAGMTRAMTPAAMERALQPAFKRLKALGAPHVHYKVCSTFDSSPRVGSIGKVLEVGAGVFRSPFIPIVAGAPMLGRYCVFGNLFARFGIGSDGVVHRLDRHPSVSRHPVTPMTEADLRIHLSKQTGMRVALFDVLHVGLSLKEARAALARMLRGKPDAVLFDAITVADLRRIGELLDAHASGAKPLFSVGSSGVERALVEHWITGGRIRKRATRWPSTKRARGPVLIGSGSCSAVTRGQIEYGLKHAFVEVLLGGSQISDLRFQKNAVAEAVEQLRKGKSVIVHTTRTGPDAGLLRTLGDRTSAVLGDALGRVLRWILEQAPVRRVCIAGGDTASYAARALGVEALEMSAPLTPGAPVCRAHAPGSPADGREFVFKGGQVGAENYFEML